MGVDICSWRARIGCSMQPSTRSGCKPAAICLGHNAVSTCLRLALAPCCGVDRLWRCGTEPSALYNGNQANKQWHSGGPRGAPPPQVTRSLFFKAPGHQVTFFMRKLKQHRSQVVFLNCRGRAVALKMAPGRRSQKTPLGPHSEGLHSPAPGGQCLDRPPPRLVNPASAPGKSSLDASSQK